MIQFKIGSKYRGKNITAEIALLETSIHVFIYGGEKNDLCTTTIYDGSMHVVTLEGKEDKKIGELFAERLATYGHVVVSEGINYADMKDKDYEYLKTTCLDMIDEMLLKVSALRG